MGVQGRLIKACIPSEPQRLLSLPAVPQFWAPLGGNLPQETVPLRVAPGPLDLPSSNHPADVQPLLRPPKHTALLLLTGVRCITLKYKQKLGVGVGGI